ncbi:MAG: glycoside hydrolase family 88 protein [Ginsengibacter sp.]
MRNLFSLLLVITIPVLTNAQSIPSYAQEMSNTVMKLWGDSPQAQGKFTKWTYDQDVILQGIQGLWKATGDAKYFDYLQKSMGFFLDDSGNISTYEFDNLTLDNIAPGRDLLLLYNVTGKKKYYDAVQTLRKQLNSKDLI